MHADGSAGEAWEKAAAPASRGWRSIRRESAVERRDADLSARKREYACCVSELNMQIGEVVSTIPSTPFP